MYWCNARLMLPLACAVLNVLMISMAPVNRRCNTADLRLSTLCSLQKYVAEVSPRFD